MSFAMGLRAILRHDPDVVMIGEIRDLETAQAATQASLTGHLVLSTLHTNDAASAAAIDRHGRRAVPCQHAQRSDGPAAGARHLSDLQDGDKSQGDAGLPKNMKWPNGAK